MAIDYTPSSTLEFDCPLVEICAVEPATEPTMEPIAEPVA